MKAFYYIAAIILTIYSSTSLAESNNAKIRIFGQNGAMAKLYPGQACTSGKSIKVSGGIGQAFGSFVGASKNESIGIPETPTTQNLSDKNGLLSKAYYKELEIPANQASAISMSFREVDSFYKINGFQYIHHGRSCKGNIYFTPKANSNYEVGFKFDNKQCQLMVNEVIAGINGEATQLVPIEIKQARDCD